MPLYSLIALVISIFGATYTALGALRNYYDAAVRQTNDLVDKKVADIRQKSIGTLPAAQNYGNSIKMWAKAWKWSYSVPIVFFLIVIYVIGIYSLWNWSSVTHPLSFLSAQNPPLAADEIIKEKQSWEQCCGLGRIILFLVIVVNGVCSVVALLAKMNVGEKGKRLGEIHQTAEEAYAKSQLERQ